MCSQCMESQIPWQLYILITPWKHLWKKKRKPFRAENGCQIIFYFLFVTTSF